MSKLKGIEMTEIKIRGSSDDLIEIEGDIDEEFTHYSDETAVLAISDGTLLSVEYDGIWRIAPIHKGSAEMTKHEGTDEDDDYTDIVTLTGNIEWVVLGTQIASKQTR